MEKLTKDYVSSTIKHESTEKGTNLGEDRYTSSDRGQQPRGKSKLEKLLQRTARASSSGGGAGGGGRGMHYSDDTDLTSRVNPAHSRRLICLSARYTEAKRSGELDIILASSAQEASAAAH